MTTTWEKQEIVSDFLQWRLEALLAGPDASVSSLDYYTHLEGEKDTTLLLGIRAAMEQGSTKPKWEIFDTIQALIAEARS